MLLPGDTIADRYEVVRELGRGGMGVVYEAVRRDIGLTVALKVLHDPAPKRASRFAHEARITASLRSDHIVRVLDFGTVDDAYPFLVMEMLEGFSLEDELHRGALSAEAAVDWLMEAAAGLAEAHEKRIVHRDLKPSNLFLARGADGGQRLKLLDFGVARALLPEQLRATEASAVMGTPPYMSPEQLRDSRQADARSDIWSLGVILYELVSGGLPFPGDTSTAVVAAIAADEPSPLPDTVAPELKSVIARCLNKDASRRFQTVAALASALEKLGGERSARAMASIRSLAEYGARGSSNQPEPTSDATQTENSTRSPDPRTHSTLGALSQTLSGSSRRWPALAPLVALAAVLGVAVVGWFWVGFGATTATSVAPATKPAETSAASAGYETTRIHLAGVSAAHQPLPVSADADPPASSPPRGRAAAPTSPPRGLAAAPSPPPRALPAAPAPPVAPELAAASASAAASPGSLPPPPSAALPKSDEPVDPLEFRK